MKKPLFLLLFVALLFSCTQNNTKLNELQKNIADYITKNATNPSSYQPVKTRIIDTVYVGKFAKGLVNLNDDEIGMIKNDIANLKKLIPGLKAKRQEQKISIVENKIKEGEASIAVIEKNNEKLRKLLKDNSIAFIRVEHDCKLKNGNGQLVDDHIFMLLDKDLLVLLAKEKSRKNSYQAIDFFKEKYLK